jgi:hypothetical protein
MLCDAFSTESPVPRAEYEGKASHGSTFLGGSAY